MYSFLMALALGVGLIGIVEGWRFVFVDTGSRVLTGLRFVACLLVVTALLTVANRVGGAP